MLFKCILKGGGSEEGFDVFSISSGRSTSIPEIESFEELEILV